MGAGVAQAPPRRRGRVVAAALVLAVVVTLVVIVRVRSEHWRAPRAFDADLWRAESGCETGLSARHAMAGAVRDALLRERPTRAELHERLGPPTFDQSPPAGGPACDWWTLGMPPGPFTFDGCWLEVGFDSDDRVTEVLAEHETTVSCR